MCEEIEDATSVVPKAIITSVIINGILAFGMVVAVLFCLGNITAAVTSSTGYPFIEIFSQATNSRGGATVMTAIVATLAFCSIIAALAGSSRMTWSFARDRGLPWWRHLSKVSLKEFFKDLLIPYPGGLSRLCTPRCYWSLHYQCMSPGINQHRLNDCVSGRRVPGT